MSLVNPYRHCRPDRILICESRVSHACRLKHTVFTLHTAITHDNVSPRPQGSTDADVEVAASPQDRPRTWGCSAAASSPPRVPRVPRCTQSDSSLPAGSGAGGDLRADRASAQPSTTRGRPRELNPRRTAAPRGCGRAPPAPAPPPAPSDGSVASDPLEVVDRRPVAIMAGTYGRMGRPTTGPGMDTDVSVQARIAPDDSDQAG
jgi:hypothetical protein